MEVPRKKVQDLGELPEVGLKLLGWAPYLGGWLEIAVFFGIVGEVMLVGWS